MSLSGSHHVSFRKRAAKYSRDPFPHPHRWTRLLDMCVYVAGVLGPLFTFPQIYIIFSTRQAGGVSILSWGTYALLDTVWILYGVVHKERAIVVTYILWCLANLLVALGAIMYGGSW